MRRARPAVLHRTFVEWRGRCLAHVRGEDQGAANQWAGCGIRKTDLNRRRLTYPALLLLEALIFHWRVLFLPGYSFPWDFRNVHVPLAAFVAGSFRRGEWPLWDPFTYCGVPIYANIQTAVFYPPVWVATLAGAWLGDGALPRLLAISVVLQTVFAGVCTFKLVRRIGGSPEAAWIAGTMYELGCFFAAQAEHMGAMQGAAWLPLIWWCVIELHEKRTRFWIAVLALALSMTILAGLPQVAVAAFFTGLLLAVILWRGVAPVLLGCWWALLLAAVQLAPTTELMRNSVAKYRAEWLGGGGGIPVGALVSLVIPNYWSVFDLGHFHGAVDLTFLYLYSSLLGLALALAAMFWKPNRWAFSFAALTGLVTMAMLGENTMLWRTLFPLLPVSVRIGIHPEFLFCAFSLGLAILAGLGASRLLKPRWQIAAGFAIACDLILVSSGRPMNTTSDPPEPGSAALVERLRELTAQTTPQWRFDTRPEVSFSWVNQAAKMGIPTAGGCDPLAPERVIVGRLSFAPGPRWGTCFPVVDLNSRVLDLMNDRVLIARDAMENPRYSLAAEMDGYRFYENTQVLPRFFLVKRVVPVSTMQEAADLLHRPHFDPASTAVVERGRAADSTDEGTVAVASYQAARIALKVDVRGESFLVVTDSYYPGWSASVDGKPVTLYATDVAFRGIEVPAGRHEIEMRFRPRVLWWAAAVSLVALLLVLLCIAL